MTGINGMPSDSVTNYSPEENLLINMLIGEIDMQENQEVSNAILVLLEYFMVPEDFDDLIGRYAATFLNR